VADAARSIRNFDQFRIATLAATLNGYSLIQLPDGRAGAYPSGTAANSAGAATLLTRGTFNIAKTTGIVLLAGGRAYWDRSAGSCTFKPVDDRDFYIGRVAEDAASANPTAVIELNEDCVYDWNMDRDSFISVMVGTQALGGFLPPQRRGGALKFVASATSEAQKVDALAKDGFAAGGAAGILEFAINLISAGSGTNPDFNIGAASGTHATDFDSITQAISMHMDGNSTKINFQSKDGTHTTAATDSTTTATAGAGNANRKECWMDLRTNSSVKLYVDGVQVLSGTTYDISAAASTWYPIIHLEKTSSTDTFEIDVDFFRFRRSEQ